MFRRRPIINNNTEECNANSGKRRPLVVVVALVLVVVLTLLLFLASEKPTWNLLSTTTIPNLNLRQHFAIASRRRTREDDWDENDWDEDDWDEDDWDDKEDRGNGKDIEKVHPDKADMGCEEYNGTMNGSDAPCRVPPPPPPPTNGQGQGQGSSASGNAGGQGGGGSSGNDTSGQGGGGGGNDTIEEGQGGESSGSDNDSDHGGGPGNGKGQGGGGGGPGLGDGSGQGVGAGREQQRLHSTIHLNISVAVPKRYKKGIPSLLTTVVKEYLTQTNVTFHFLQTEYNDGRHFYLEVTNPPQREDEEWEDEEDEEDEDEYEVEEEDAMIEPPPATATSHYPNATVIGLLALKAETGHLIDYVNHTDYAWVHHTVFLICHSEENTLLRDPELIAWLRDHVVDLIYQDIRLEGPLGPYYDTNLKNQNRAYNTGEQISFLEWSIQEFGVAVGGMSIPGEERWDSSYFPVPPETVTTPTAAPIGYGSSSDDPDLDRTFNRPLSTTYGTRQWFGLACLLTVAVSIAILSAVSNQLAKRREQDELWGNLMVLENAKEDADYLDVGWRFAMTDQDEMGQTNNNYNQSNNSRSNGPTQQNMMMMEVFDKRGVGYRDGDSLLMGGYEYKPTVSAVDQSVAASGLGRPPSYRVDHSVAPFS